MRIIIVYKIANQANIDEKHEKIAYLFLSGQPSAGRDMACKSASGGNAPFPGAGNIPFKIPKQLIRGRLLLQAAIFPGLSIINRR